VGFVKIGAREGGGGGVAGGGRLGGVRKRDSLLDPWAGIVAGVAGGLAWAVTVPAGVVAVPIGVGVAAAVYGVKVAAGALARRGNPQPAPGELPRPEKGSPAETWQTRALRAISDLHDLTRSDPNALQALSSVEDGARQTEDQVRRLAGQATAVGRALYRIPTPRLADERARLAAEIDGSASAELREEHRRSLRSVEEQLAVADRLTSARDTLLARLQSTALGLEGLVARTAEVLALSASAGAGTGDDGIAGLAAELDGLRAGLAETEELSRQVLGRR
jgi:hypothetical protein